MVGSDAHPDVDELFEAGPEEFVARRQALVKQLKAAGERERAAEVAALRRPTVAAWAVNQLARRHPDELSHLLELGRELEEAHEGLLGGARPDSAVAAGRRRREAVAALADLAVGLLTESGRGADAHRDAIADTLDAASLNPQAGAVVQAGRLTKELDAPSGFGLDWVADDWSPPPRRPPEAKADGRDDAPVDDSSDGAANEEAAEARREAHAAEAEAAAASAREEAKRAAKAAADAEQEVDRLELELDEAKSAARAARRAAADAAAQARKAAAAAEAATAAVIAGRSG